MKQKLQKPLPRFSPKLLALIALPLIAVGIYTLFFAKAAVVTTSSISGDVNGDGTVNISDLGIVLQNYGKTETTTTTPTNQTLGFNTLNSSASDEFTGSVGSKPNSSKWGAKTFTATNGSVTYWNGLNNVQLDGNGFLDVFATRQTNGTWNSSWISGAPSYTGSHYIESRGKVPAGQGTWSSPIWEWDAPYGSQAIENDVIEQLGIEPTSYHTTLHGPGGIQLGKTYSSPITLANDYHVYGAAVYADRVDYYFDGAKVQTITKTEFGSNWGYVTTPMVLNINLDMGGWGGTPSASLPSTVHMLVDYIRVYTP